MAALEVFHQPVTKIDGENNINSQGAGHISFNHIKYRLFVAADVPVHCKWLTYVFLMYIDPSSCFPCFFFFRVT